MMNTAEDSDGKTDGTSPLLTISKPLLKEAWKIVSDGKSGDQGVQRIKDIFSAGFPHIDSSDIDVKFPPYGETLLLNALHHSVSMVRQLLDMGADPNIEHPLDELLEIPEDERTPDEVAMIGLLVAKGAKKSMSLEDQVTEVHSELFLNARVDPSQVNAMPEGICKTVFLRQLGQNIDLGSSRQNDLTPEQLMAIEYQKEIEAVRSQHDALPQASKKLIQEAFHLLSITDDNEPNFTSSADTVQRIKQIFSNTTQDVNPNFRSYTQGETLLFATVLNDFLDEGHALELVKFLLDVGADPNLENVVDRDTALDWYEWTYSDPYEMTQEQRKIVALLKKRGARVLPKDNNGNIIGERVVGPKQLKPNKSPQLIP